MAVILLAARLLGRIASRARQPAVIGEILAGILLGPSLLGWLLPGVSAFLFAPDSLGPLRFLSQIGIVLFLFVVGMELDLAHLSTLAKTAIAVSYTSILLPCALGIALAVPLYPAGALPGIPFRAFGLFLGVAMSITAFPVLARILEDRGLTRTALGRLAITCAAVDDATAWCLLAVVVAIVTAAGTAAVFVRIGLVLVFVAAMLRLVRPLLSRLFDAASRSRSADPLRTTAALLCLTASAWTTERLGIHALFGAFLAGIAMPSDPDFRRRTADRLGGVASVLLPLFFALSGLRTRIGLLSDATAWAQCAAVVGVATVGKLGGSMLAARATGIDWTNAFRLGALMNTRGLVELVVLNLGYDLKILSPRVFAMMVVMAFVTTFATGPLLSLADRRTGGWAEPESSPK